MKPPSPILLFVPSSEQGALGEIGHFLPLELIRSCGNFVSSFIYSTSQHFIGTTCLNNCLGPSHLKHLPAPLSPIRQGEVDDLSILGKLAGGENGPGDSDTRDEAPVPSPSLLDSVSSFDLPSCSQTLLEIDLRSWEMGSVDPFQEAVYLNWWEHRL